MNANSLVRRYRGQANTRMLIIVGSAVVVVVLLALYLLRPTPEPIPETGRPLETVEPAQSAEERGDRAREIIERLEADPTGPDYAGAYARAQDFLAEGQLADAQLLYFFAARGGHTPAAFDLGTFNDPSQRTAAAGLITEPDPFQAYRWYTAARDAGHEEASARLEELHAWAESASESGDADAEQLLLLWENEK